MSSSTSRLVCRSTLVPHLGQQQQYQIQVCVCVTQEHVVGRRDCPEAKERTNGMSPVVDSLIESRFQLTEILYVSFNGESVIDLYDTSNDLEA